MLVTPDLKALRCRVSTWTEADLKPERPGLQAFGLVSKDRT